MACDDQAFAIPAVRSRHGGDPGKRRLRRRLVVRDEHEDEVEFSGTISSLSPLTIAGRTVKTDASTKYLGHDHQTVPSTEVLKVDNKVEVDGVKEADGSVLAKKIQLDSESED